MWRVLHVVGNQGEIGGSEVSLLRSLRALPAGEFDLGAVLVVDGGASDAPVLARFRAEGVPHAVVRMRGPLDPRGWRAFSRAARDPRPDLVHTHGERALLLRCGTDPRGRVPWVHTVHGWVAPTARRARSVAVARRLLRAADRVVCVSEAQRRGLGPLDPDRVVVLPNAAPPAAVPDPARAAALRARLGVPADAPIVAWVGRLAPEKDPLAVVEVARTVLAERPDARFLVAGGGPLGGPLRDAVGSAGLRERVLPLGSLVDPMPVLEAAQVLVMTSRSEADPLVVLEAAALGVPAVVPAVEALGDSVEDGVTGLRVPPGDPRRLGEAVSALLRDPDGRARLGREARARLASGVRSPAAHGEALARVYRAVLAARGH